MSEHSQIKKSLVIFVCILLFVIFGESFVLIKEHEKENREIAPTNLLQAREYCKNKIDTVGAPLAYELFKKDTARLSYGAAHELAHVMGGLIYDKLGLEGVSVCDNSFALGCFHSFFGKAIMEHGVDVVYDLDKNCEKKWHDGGLTCAHGLGHGLMEYFNTKKDGLNQALSVCSKLTWQQPLGGCSDGVFMEYDFHTLIDDLAPKYREFDPRYPNAPCDSVLSSYRESCYFEQAQWWYQVLGQNATKTGELCLNADSVKNQKTCFRGIGGIVGPLANFDVQKILSVCREMPDNESNVFCRQGAAWSFAGEPDQRGKFGPICDGLEGNDLSVCESGKFENGDKL